MFGLETFLVMTQCGDPKFQCVSFDGDWAEMFGFGGGVGWLVGGEGIEITFAKRELRDNS